MKNLLVLLLAVLSVNFHLFSQWQSVGSGANGSSHGLLVWNNQLVNLGSFNNPCQKVSVWNGTSWSCLGGGVGLVARAGTVWNGNLVVVGDFWNVQQPCANCNGIAMWDGTQWTNLGTGFNNDVLTITVWNGELVAAGDFTQADGQPCSRIAKWNGTTWQGMGGTNDFDNDIRCLAVFQGELWAGGDFSNVGGCSACDGVVKWNGTSWVGGNSGVDIIGGVDSTVRVLYVNPNDNNLYMGGHFLEVHDGDAASPNTNMRGVARYDGSNWYPLGTGVNDYVRAIHEYNGNLIVGGIFTNAGGVAANKVAKWNPNTSTWSAMGLGMDAIGIDEYVKSAAVYNGTFYAGGAFTQTEGNTNIAYIARWYEAPTLPPVASFTASTTTVCVGQQVNFTSTSSGSPTGYSWTFTGGTPTSSTSANPSVSYASAGTYAVSLTVTNANGSDTETQTSYITVVAAPTTPVITASGSTTICQGASLTLTSSSSTGNTWSNGSTNSSITVNAAGTYTVTVGASGCSATSQPMTVTVVAPPATPTISTSGSTTICAGGSVILTSSATSGNTWSNSASSQSITVTSSGTYTVSVSNGTCSATSVPTTVTVNPVPATPLITPSGSTTICQGNTLTLTSSATTGNTWSTGATTQSIPVTSAGTYSVSVSNGTCSATSQPITVTVVAPPSTPTISPSGSTAFCAGGSVVLTSSSTSGNSWSNSANTQSITVTSSGTYTVSVSNGTCSATSLPTTVTVNPVPATPVITPSGSTTICQGNTVLLTSSATSGNTWSTGATTQSIPVSTAGTFSVSVSNGTCSATSQPITVTVVTSPAAPVITVNGSTTFCSGESVVLTSSEVSGNTWSTGETTQSISVSAGGIYTVTVGPSGCSAQSQPVSITVLNVPAVPSITAQPNTAICAGETVQLLSSSGNGNTWSTGATSNVITVSPLNTTTYGLSVTENGCSSDTVYATVTVNPIPNASATQTAFNELTAQNVNGATYSWIDCNDPSANLSDFDQQFTASYNSEFAVVVNLNGCEDTSACLAITTIGLNEMTAASIQLYPNPTQEYLHVVSNKSEVERVELIDMNGKLIAKFLGNSKELVLDLHDLETGMYQVLVVTTNGDFNRQIIQFISK